MTKNERIQLAVLLTKAYNEGLLDLDKANKVTYWKGTKAEVERPLKDAALGFIPMVFPGVSDDYEAECNAVGVTPLK